MTNLMIREDLGDRRSDEIEVLAVPHVPFTDTWHPIHHGTLINALHDSLMDIGVGVVSKEYSLRGKDGYDMFGFWELDQRINGAALSIGLRNSMIKHFALGLVAGLRTFVCTNLQMSGEFLKMRKHTGRLDNAEIQSITNGMTKTMIPKLEAFAEWQTSLKDFVLPTLDFKELTYNAMISGAVPPSKFNNFLKCYETECKLEGGKNVYAFNGAVTRLMRSESLINVNAKSKALKETIDSYLAPKKFNRRIELEMSQANETIQ